MSGNPLSERSELWISTNAFSRLWQALEFRPAATESQTGCGVRGVLTIKKSQVSHFILCETWDDFL